MQVDPWQNRQPAVQFMQNLEQKLTQVFDAQMHLCM